VNHEPKEEFVGSTSRDKVTHISRRRKVHNINEILQIMCRDEFAQDEVR
jgi:hypothetical protein